MGSATSDSTHDKDAVYKKSAIYDMLDALNNMETSENDLKSFKSYIESEREDSDSDLHKAVNGVRFLNCQRIRGQCFLLNHINISVEAL